MTFGIISGFVTRNWKMILIICGAILILFWINSKTGLAQKYWNMIFTEIKDDREEIEKQIIEVVNQTADERDALKKKLAILQADKEKIQREKCDLENEMSILQGRLNAVVVPPASDPDAVVDAFNRVFGPGARVYNNP